MSTWEHFLEDEFSWQSPIRPRHSAQFSDEQGRVWLTISKNGLITLPKHYAWNGCSPQDRKSVV